MYFSEIAFLQGKIPEFSNLVWLWHKGSAVLQWNLFAITFRAGQKYDVCPRPKKPCSSQATKITASLSMINSLQRYLSSLHYSNVT